MMRVSYSERVHESVRERLGEGMQVAEMHGEIWGQYAGVHKRLVWCEHRGAGWGKLTPAFCDLPSLLPH